MSNPLTWADCPGSSVRSDGMKIGEFIENGAFTWWIYPAGYRPRGDIQPFGPFNTRQEAKDASTSWLGMES